MVGIYIDGYYPIYLFQHNLTLSNYVFNPNSFTFINQHHFIKIGEKLPASF